MGTLVADQERWKLLEKCVLGLIASTLNDSLINHVNYMWTPPVGSAPTTFPSMAKALMDKLHALFGTTGISGQFLLFYKAMRICIKHSSEITPTTLKLLFIVTKITCS